MLRIIPTPSDPEVLYTFPEPTWEDVFGGFDYGVYLEYSENEVISFKFHYTLGHISILRGAFSEGYTKKEMIAFFECYVREDELWEWLDTIPFRMIRSLPKDDPEITGIWKMNCSVKYCCLDPKYYYEFQVSTVNIRCIPYDWMNKEIKIEVSDEENKFYWITLCLLKYQHQS